MYVLFVMYTMSLNSVRSFVIENCNGPTIENGLNNVCLHPLSRTFTFTNYKMKKRCVVLIAEKMQSAFFLARIDRIEETKRTLHERDTVTRQPFLCMALRV